MSRPNLKLVVDGDAPPPAYRFKTGDKVRLKGGSDDMTVWGTDKNVVSVNWTSELGEPQDGVYLEDMLEFVPVKRKKRTVKEYVFTPSPPPKKPPTKNRATRR